MQDESPLKAVTNGTYDTVDLAAILKCSTRYVRTLVAAGKVPGIIRCGRLLRFHAGIVQEWLLEQSRGVNRG